MCICTVLETAILCTLINNSHDRKSCTDQLPSRILILWFDKLDSTNFYFLIIGIFLVLSNCGNKVMSASFFLLEFFSSDVHSVVKVPHVTCSRTLFTLVFTVLLTTVCYAELNTALSYS